MAVFKDFRTDSDGDLVFSDGDVFVGQSDSQHVEHILIADKGHYRQFPLLGVGIIRYVKGNINPVALEQEIITNLESDNFTINEITIDPNDLAQINIDAQRKEKA